MMWSRLQQIVHCGRQLQFPSQTLVGFRIPQPHPSFDHQPSPSGDTWLNPRLAGHPSGVLSKPCTTRIGQRGSTASYIKVKKEQISLGGDSGQTGGNCCVSATCATNSCSSHGT